MAYFLHIINMMKIAIPKWQGRISPVFDVAQNVLLVDIYEGSEKTRQNVKLRVNDIKERADLLEKLDVELLICGAISWPLEAALEAKGIEIIPQTCGDVNVVIGAYINGKLDQDAFLMPGSCGRRREFRRRRHRSRPQKRKQIQ